MDVRFTNEVNWKIHLGCKLLSRSWPNYSQEWLNVHLGCKSILCISRLELMAEHVSRLWVTLNTWDENHWGEWMNTPSASELLSSAKSDLNYWQEHPSSLWVPLQCLSRYQLLIRMGEHLSRKWVPFRCFSRSEPLMRMGDHPSRKLVTLQCLRKSKPLTRMVEHPSREWVPSQCLSRSKPLTRTGEYPSRE